MNGLKRLIKRIYSVENMLKPHQIQGELPSTGDAYRTVKNIALPSVVEMVLMSLIGSVDTMMVGGLGQEALSAVGLPGQPRMLMLCVFFALNVGVTAIVARRKGENRQKDANRTLRTAIVLVLLISLILTVVSIMMAEPLMRLAGGNENTPEDTNVLRMAVEYFSILMCAMPVNALAMCINAAQRGIGNTRITMYVNIISNLVNVLFNYLLINGIWIFDKMGVRGAAIASVIGMGVGCLMSLYTVTRAGHHQDYLHIVGGSWKPDAEAMRAIAKVGGGAMVEQLSMRFGFFVYSRILYGLGVTAFAAHQICSQFLAITFTVGDGIGIAGTSLVGQYLGAKRPDLSMLYEKVSLRLALTVSLVVGALIVCFRYPLTGLFIGPETANAQIVLGLAADTLLVVALMQPFQIASVVVSSGLRGAGDNLYVAAVMLICVSVIRPTMAYVAVHWIPGLPLAGVWLFGLSEIAARISCFYPRFAGGKWQLKKV